MDGPGPYWPPQQWARLPHLSTPPSTTPVMDISNMTYDKACRSLEDGGQEDHREGERWVCTFTRITAWTKKDCTRITTFERFNQITCTRIKWSLVSLKVPYSGSQPVHRSRCLIQLAIRREILFVNELCYSKVKSVSLQMSNFLMDFPGRG